MRHAWSYQDRATKIAEFIGNQIVNESKGSKPEFDPIVPPSFGRAENGSTLPVRGAKDAFLEMGAKDYTQSLLKEKRLLVTDTTMRDAHQSLMATRLRTNDVFGIALASCCKRIHGDSFRKRYATSTPDCQ